MIRSRMAPDTYQQPFMNTLLLLYFITLILLFHFPKLHICHILLSTLLTREASIPTTRPTTTKSLTSALPDIDNTSTTTRWGHTLLRM